MQVRSPAVAPGFSTGFSTDLTHMMRDPRLVAIHTWCFGHTHYNSDQRVHGVRLVSNQCGYAGERSAGYEESLVIEVPRAWVGRDATAGGSGKRKCDIM